MTNTKQKLNIPVMKKAHNHCNIELCCSVAMTSDEPHRLTTSFDVSNKYDGKFSVTNTDDHFLDYSSNFTYKLSWTILMSFCSLFN